MSAVKFDDANAGFDSLTVAFDARVSTRPPILTTAHGGGELIRAWHVRLDEAWTVGNPKEAWRVRPE